MRRHGQYIGGAVLSDGRRQYDLCRWQPAAEGNAWPQDLGRSRRHEVAGICLGHIDERTVKVALFSSRAEFVPPGNVALPLLHCVPLRTRSSIRSWCAVLTFRGSCCRADKSPCKKVRCKKAAREEVVIQ